MKTQLQLLLGLAAVLLLVAACAGKQPAAASEPIVPEPTTPTEEVSPVEGTTETATEPATKIATTSTTSKPSGPATHAVEITASGFLPGTVTVKAGDKVEWTNEHSVDAWPASAVHPTHKAYPGSDINKCESKDRDNIFDACQRLRQGGSWSFVFREKGTWKYHNHLNPGQTGTVVVE
ncbi:MAG: hypothetical protein AABX13_04150 [Nanoarchaeota archaeon]